MRAFVVLCTVGVAACGGSAAKRDSLPRDTVSAPATAAPADSPVSPRRTPPGDRRERTAPQPSLGTAAVAAADTVRGIVSVNGSDRDHHTMIARPGGGKHIEIVGPLAAIVAHTGGTDVWVSGSMTGTTLMATRFIVRTVDGSPAIDGTLQTEGPTLYIVTADGARTRIANPPPKLVGRDGARVWITGDPARGVETFGFIDPAR